MKQLNTRSLEYLNAIARYGSLRKAASRLNVDPSTVSRLLTQLEDRIGMPIWDRTGGGQRLTEAGSELVAYYRKMEAGEAAVLSRINDLASLRRGEVKIIVGEGFITDLISSSLESFLSTYPGIRLTVDIAGAQDAVQWLAEGHFDFAVTYASVANPKLHCLLETSHPLDLIAPPKHPLAQKEGPISFNEIVDSPLALIDTSTGMGRLVSLVAETNHVRLEPRLRTNSVTVLKSFVASGVGIAFMPQLTVSQEVADGSIVACPVDHPLMRDASARVLCVEGQELTLPAQALLRHLQENAQFLKAVN